MLPGRNSRLVWSASNNGLQATNAIKAGAGRPKACHKSSCAARISNCKPVLSRPHQHAGTYRISSQGSGWVGKRPSLPPPTAGRGPGFSESTSPGDPLRVRGRGTTTGFLRGASLLGFHYARCARHREPDGGREETLRGDFGPVRFRVPGFRRGREC